MEQADTNLISGLANEFNLDTAWELRAVTAFTKAASAEIRAYIRGHPHKNKQVDLLNELMQASAAGLGVGSAAGTGAAAGQGTAQAGDAVEAAGLGMGSAAGAGVRPTVFLRSPLPDAALPSRFDKPSRSLKIDHAEPVDCKTWEHVAPQERIPALFGRLAAACGSHATASGFQAMGGAGHALTASLFGECRDMGGVLLQQQGPPEVLINEAVACFGTRPLLKVLTILVNGLLERLRGGASADRTAAAAAVGSGAAAKPAPAGITPGVEPAAGSDAAAVPAARTGRVSSVYWGAEMSLEKIREVASSQEGLEWLVQGGGGSLRPDMPLIVVISDDDATWQQCRSFVEMKAPALMLEGRTPRSLVDLWLSGDTRVRAILAQVNEYMDHLGVRYAIVSCHYAMWAPPPLPPLLIEADPEVLHVGYAGLACTGRVNGEEAVLKILDSDEHGVAAFEAECSAYRALAALQGDVLPRLLAAGRLGDLAPPPPLSGGEEEEEWEPPPDGDVRFIATSRVRGLTLRQAAEQWGYIQPTAAAAAVHALKVLHAADIRAAGGGSGGRFLHGDIRLSNFMLLLPAAEAAVGPRCVVIDLGLSRLDGTEAEQQAEVRQLEQRLQCGSG
eukprot:XP_001689483.1 predicted protein [Chlamydomonas reinhardtii]